MKSFLGSLSVFFLLLLVSTPLFSQVEHTTIPLSAPTVINFKEKAQYQLSNPRSQPKERFIEQGEDREGKREFKSRPVPDNAKKFDITLPQNTLRTVSPSPVVSFDGTLDGGYLIPPDVSGAAGKDYIMESSNQQLDIYDKSGALSSVLDVDVMFNSTDGNDFFDPHVVYDAIHDRFIVCVDGFYSANDHSALFLAISQSPDPNGLWYIYSIEAITNANDFLDFPMVGFNNNWIVVTGNDFLGNGNTTTKIYVFNRADLYSGSAGTVHTYTDGSIFGITPAVTMDVAQDVEYLVADYDGSSGGYGYMKLYRITGTPNSPAYAAGNTIGVNQPWDEDNENAPQKNSTHKIEVSDTRVSTPIYINGTLWFTHSVFLPAGNPNRAAVDWWQIDPVANDLLQFGRIEDNSGSIFYFYPSISVNNEDDALIGYSVSSSTMYASTQYSFHSYLDAPNTMQDGYMYQAGLNSYWKDFGGGRNRWGDYSGTCTDPVDGSFWTFQEYANTPANTWATSIANVGGVPCNDTPAAGYISALFSSICPGEATILNLLEYSNGVSGIEIQWQQSADGINGWTNSTGIGNTEPRYETGAINDATFFRCIVTCSQSGAADTTDVFLESVNGFVAVANDTICSTGLHQLIVNSTGVTNWYATDTSSIPLATSDTLNINISGDSTFYVSTSTFNHTSVGIPNSGTGGYYNYTYSAGLVFQALSSFILDTVYVYANSTGTVKVNLYNVAANKVTDSVTVNITSAQVNNKTAVPLHFSITGGNAYNLNASGSTVTAIYRNNAGAVYPYEVPGIVSITQAINNASGYYYFFYDWRITSGCATEKFPVQVHINVPVVVASTATDTICFGQHVILYASGASTYVWSPGGQTGSSANYVPFANTTYTVIGTDVYGCTASAQLDVAVIMCQVGIEETSVTTSLQVYPNPTSGVFDLSMEGLHAGNYTITLLNLYGQKIMELRKTVTAGMTALSVDASNLPSGVYFIQVADGNQQWMNRLLKE